MHGSGHPGAPLRADGQSSGTDASGHEQRAETSRTPWIGRSPRRAGGIDRVTGAQIYAADIRLDGVLHVKLVHLSCARARIRAIDTSDALQVEGVRCILTAADLPQPVPRYGPVYKDRPILAVDEAKFFGEPVAAVAAETEDAAEAAAAAVRVEYEELPAVLTVDAALDPRSPLVQDPAIRPNDPLAGTNTLSELRSEWGSVEDAVADCVIEHDYTFPMVTHFAIEPHAFLAAPDANGVTIWSPIQHPYVLQHVVASALGWPLAKVRIVAPDPGGAFGGKGWPKLEPLMAMLALRTGRPVRLVLSLEETFQAVRRTSARIHLRTGFDLDGRLVFHDFRGDFLIGAYADIGARVVSKAGYAACGPYRTPNARIVARALLSHTTPGTAFRGFGTPQVSWAVESQMNEAARRLGIDPIDLRRRNVPEKGELFIPDDTPADGDWKQLLDRAAEAMEWGTPLPANRGRGVSLGIKASSTASASCAVARLHYDGSVSVLTGTSDMGQGARTILAQIIAEELGVDLDRIAVIMGDTAVVPFDSSTSASRSSVFMGNALVKACRHIKEQLREIAAETFGSPKEAIDAGGGCVRVDDRAIPYAELLAAHFGPPRGEVIGLGQVRSRYIADHPLGGHPAFWEVTCTAAEVEVDPETGMVDIGRLVLVSDIGRALNPRQVEAQDEGAVVMGLGHTLMEQLLLDEHGCILNLGALDYRIPTIQDVSRSFRSILVENGDGPGPYGSKGAGEGGILAIAAAVGAAVNEAAGVEIRDLPLTPERIWRAIKERSEPGKRLRPLISRGVHGPGRAPCLVASVGFGALRAPDRSAGEQ